METFVTKYNERVEEIVGRINKLVDEKYFLEIVFWFSTIFENSLTHILCAYSTMIKYAGIKTKTSTKNFKPYEIKEYRKKYKTLGRLIDEFKRYSNDSEVVQQLDEFLLIRNTVIHELYDTKKDLKEIEEKIIFHTSEDTLKKDLKQHWWYTASKLADLNLKINKELNSLLQNL